MLEILACNCEAFLHCWQDSELALLGCEIEVMLTNDLIPVVRHHILVTKYLDPYRLLRNIDVLGSYHEILSSISELRLQESVFCDTLIYFSFECFLLSFIFLLSEQGHQFIGSIFIIKTCCLVTVCLFVCFGQINKLNGIIQVDFKNLLGLIVVILIWITSFHNIFSYFILIY